MMTATDQEGAGAPVAETTPPSLASAAADDTTQGAAPEAGEHPSLRNEGKKGKKGKKDPEALQPPTPPGKDGSANKPPKSERRPRSRDFFKDYVYFDPGTIGSIKVTMEVPIGSDLGQNAIDTYLPQMEAIIPKLYDFVENRLRYGIRHVRSVELGNMIDKRMERSFAMADNQLKVDLLEERLTKAGIDFKPLFESRAVTVQFSTPHARRFVEGVQMQDRLATLYQLAWVAGLVDTREQREAFFKTTAVIGAAFNRVNGMMKAVNRGINPLIESGRRDGKTLADADAAAKRVAAQDAKVEGEAAHATAEVVEPEGGAVAA